MTTALVVVDIEDPARALRVALALGAPFIVRPQGDRFDLRVADPEAAGAPTEWRIVDQEAASELKPLLQPEAATKIKAGLRQLPLFELPVNFLAAARSDSTKNLGEIVGDALSWTAQALAHSGERRRKATRRDRRDAARLVVGSLTALVSRDAVPSEFAGYPNVRHDALDVIEHAAERYPDTFSWLRYAPPSELNVLAELTHELGLGINYRSMDPLVLCHVYEQSLVDTAERRRLGIHYTPSDLATRMVAELPIELIDPEDRYVLDPACGSGSLLIAAHERLRQLQPPDRTLEECHRDLQQRLRGYDIDPFAAELARLALLLKSQPAGNGWRIEATDTLAISDLQMRPRIIVMNPPWKLERKGKRRQRADQFMRWAADVLVPGGLLGAIVPTSWLSARNSAGTRQLLETNFEVFDIWRLPQNTFKTSQQSPSVILARKGRSASIPGFRVVKHVKSSERSTFLAGSPPQANFLIGPTSMPLRVGISPMEFGAMSSPLGDMALVVTGQQRLAGAEDRGVGIHYLPNFENTDPYSRVSIEGLWRLRFPQDFQNARGKSILGRKKVLVSAAGDPGTPWRLKVALDLDGIGCSNGMRGIAPLDQSNSEILYALIAILGSGFANAYAAQFGSDRNIPAAVIKSFPVPTDYFALERLARLGKAAVDAATSPAARPNELHRLLDEIEVEVWSTYDVDERCMARAQRLLADHLAPEGRIRYTSTPIPDASESSMMWRVGAVHDVDGPDVRIWINGVTPLDGVSVELPHRMPGWLIRPGTTFEARHIEAPEDIECAEFKFQSMSWQTDPFEDLPTTTERNQA